MFKGITIYILIYAKQYVTMKMNDKIKTTKISCLKYNCQHI